ncbi:UNVERIFIED_CONTAM: hypothetical protein FKN15_024198 [Acipenser sinensis]
MNTLSSEACAVSRPLLYTADSPCSRLRATASEDNAALGSLQACPQAPGQTTGVAGARMLMAALEAVISVRCFIVGMILRGIGPCGQTYFRERLLAQEPLAAKTPSHGNIAAILSAPTQEPINSKATFHTAPVGYFFLANQK